MIELLTVVLIIGILAALALPAFLGQADKARDTNTKADVRNAVSQMEACFAEPENYGPCPDPEHPLGAGDLAHDHRRRHRLRRGQDVRDGHDLRDRPQPLRHASQLHAAGQGGCRNDSSW